MNGSINESNQKVDQIQSAADLISEAPEKQRDDDAPPQLGHDIEQTKAPNPENGNRPEEAGSEDPEQPIGDSHGVDQITVGVEQEGEGAEEGDEGEHASVEELLPGQDVGELGVEEHEADGHGEVHPRLQEGDDLGAAALGRDHQHVLGVAEDGVVEQDAEEHQTQGQHLLQGGHLHSQHFRRRRCSGRRRTGCAVRRFRRGCGGGGEDGWAASVAEERRREVGGFGGREGGEEGEVVEAGASRQGGRAVEGAQWRGKEEGLHGGGGDTLAEKSGKGEIFQVLGASVFHGCSRWMNLPCNLIILLL